MADKVFLDTNILLRIRFAEMADHARCKALVAVYENQNAELWISRQVVREFLVQVTNNRLLGRALTIAELEAEIAALYRLFHVADETQAVTDRLLQLVKDVPTGGKQIHDANIVATMLVNGISTLLTLNGEDMRRFEPLISIAAPQA